VFLVEPMVAKLVLPLLGGSPAVWNTSLAFFQIALLVGYGYAHLLQRLPSVRSRRSSMSRPGRWPPWPCRCGSPPCWAIRRSTWPIPWLLAALTISIGAPFAALSATAPLVQAWFARSVGPGAARPYGLYAASNLGSLLALLAYPIVVEPLLALRDQRLGWTPRLRRSSSC
jgi:hypothetical protein